MTGRRPNCFRALLPMLFLMGALGALPSTAQAADDVIYPRTAAAPGAPVDAGGTGSRQWLTMLLGLTCAAGAGWLYFRNRGMGGGTAGRVERKLTIAESRALGNRQHLLVADYDGKKYLLGVCPGRIDLLTPLNDEKPGRS